MIENEFNTANIPAVNFGVCLKPNADIFFVPTDNETKEALRNILADTVVAFNGIESNWELFDVAEDYGERRRIFVPRSDPLMTDISAIYDAGTFADLVDVTGHLDNIDYYFAEFIDDQGRRIFGVRKSAILKRTLKSRNRLVRLVDDTLQMIVEDVLRLDSEFDLLIAIDNIFVLNARNAEAAARISENVAAAAEAKVQAIHDAVTFLDMSRIRDKIKKHPRMARNAHSVAKREDLPNFSRARIIEMADMHGIKFQEVAGGRLQCRVADEGKLLELLDARRYQVDLIGDGGDPYRASARQKVFGE